MNELEQMLTAEENVEYKDLLPEVLKEIKEEGKSVKRAELKVRLQYLKKKIDQRNELQKEVGVLQKKFDEGVTSGSFTAFDGASDTVQKLRVAGDTSKISVEYNPVCFIVIVVLIGYFAGRLFKCS